MVVPVGEEAGTGSGTDRQTVRGTGLVAPGRGIGPLPDGLARGSRASDQRARHDSPVRGSTAGDWSARRAHAAVTGDPAGQSAGQGKDPMAGLHADQARNRACGPVTRPDTPRPVRSCAARTVALLAARTVARLDTAAARKELALLAARHESIRMAAKPGAARMAAQQARAWLADRPYLPATCLRADQAAHSSDPAWQHRMEPVPQPDATRAGVNRRMRRGGARGGPGVVDHVRRSRCYLAG